MASENGHWVRGLAMNVQTYLRKMRIIAPLSSDTNRHHTKSIEIPSLKSFPPENGPDKLHDYLHPNEKKTLSEEDEVLRQILAGVCLSGGFIGHLTGHTCRSKGLSAFRRARSWAPSLPPTQCFRVNKIFRQLRRWVWFLHRLHSSVGVLPTNMFGIPRP